MSFKFLAAPYHNEDIAIMQERFEKTEAVLAHFLQDGQAVFSPIVMCHDLALDYGLGLQAKDWVEINDAFLERANELIVLMLPGWEDSVGVQGEIAYSHTLGIPILYYDPVSLGIMDGTTNGPEAGPLDPLLHGIHSQLGGSRCIPLLGRRFNYCFLSPGKDPHRYGLLQMEAKLLHHLRCPSRSRN